MNSNRNPPRSGSADESGTFAAVETLRGSAGAPETPEKEGRISTFWKVFGGTLLSIAALVAITLFQHFNNSLNSLRTDLSHRGTDLHKDIGRLGEAQADLVKKDEFSTRMKSVWDNIKEVRDNGTSIVALKERVALMEQQFQASEDQRKELTRELQRLREARAAEEERRELLQAIHQLRERLAVMEGRQAGPALQPAVHKEK